MRVLVWSGAFWPQVGGIEIFTAQLLLALQERGYQFTVVTSLSDPSLPTNAYYGGIPIFRFPFLSYSSLDQLMSLRQRVAELKRTFTPDLVHIHSVNPSNFFHLTTTNAHPTPFLVTLHGEWPQQADALMSLTLRNAVWVVGCSEAILLRGQQFVPEIIPRSSVIYNARKEPSLLPGPLPSKAPRVLCLGRLAPEKGFDLALTAFAAVIERHPHARLLIAGDGPARSDLERQAGQSGLGRAVDFVGWVAPDQIPALLNGATAVVIPSRQEGLPLVAVEAALMARPVVATRVGGLPEAIVHQQTGVLVEPEDAKALAEAIAGVLAHPETAAQMGRAAYRRARDVFSWERHVNAYDALYQKLIADWRRSTAPRPGNQVR